MEPFHYEGEDDGGFDAEPLNSAPITSAYSSSSSAAAADADAQIPRRRIFRLPSVTSRDVSVSMHDAVEVCEHACM
jgi:hypothetical protein